MFREQLVLLNRNFSEILGDDTKLKKSLRFAVAPNDKKQITNT